MADELERIPEDLKGLYRQANLACDANLYYANLTKGLIERIAKLEAKLEEPLKCSQCTALIPQNVVIRCVDCKQPLCEQHIFSHFSQEEKRIRCELESRNGEMKYLEAELQRLRTENATLTKKNAEIRQLQFKGATVHCYGSHVSPDVESCRENAVKEPDGERLRNELEAWLIDNKIVGILMDTKHHFVSVDCAPTLPPNLRSVLTHWGAITVEADEYGEYTPIRSQRAPATPEEPTRRKK